MPTFFTIAGVKIQLFYDDHVPPHFHAEIAEYEALIGIEANEILAGKLPNKKKKLILEWAKVNEQELMAIWESLQIKDNK